MSIKVAIVGATGAVGEELLNVLSELDLPVSSILPLASAKSAGSSSTLRPMFPAARLRKPIPRSARYAAM